MTLNNPTGRTAFLSREELLHRFWRAEVDAGADPVTACERMGDFSARLDAEFERDLNIIRQCVGRKS